LNKQKSERFAGQMTDDRKQRSDDRKQRSDDRIQITDAGNQVAWIVHSRNPFVPPAHSVERCHTLCAMPFLPVTRNWISDGRKQMTENRGQMTDDRIQIADAGNHVAWIVHSRNPFDPPAHSVERCHTLCAMPFALCPFCP
jgi:coproporphyrinogen III oxidase